MNRSSKKRSLRIAALSFDIFLLLLIIAALIVTYSVLGNIINRQRRTDHERLLGSLNELVNDFLLGEINSIETSLPYVSDLEEEKRKQFWEYYYSDLNYSIYRVNPLMQVEEIIVYSKEEEARSLAGLDLSRIPNAQFFRQVFDSGKTGQTPVHISTVSGRQTMTFLFPFEGDILAVEPDIESLFSKINNTGLINLYENSSVFLIKPLTGEILYSSSDEIFPYLDFLRTSGEIDIRGEPHFYFKETLANIHLDLVVLTSTEFYGAAVARIRRYYIFFSILIIFLYILKRIWEQYSFFRPLDKLFGFVAQNDGSIVSLASPYNEWDSIEKKFNAFAADLSRNINHLKVTLNSIADAVMVTDSSGMIMDLNPAGQRLLSGAFEGYLVWKVMTLTQPEGSATIISPIKRVLQTRNSHVERGEALLKVGENEAVPVTFSCAPILDENNVKIGAVLVLRDISSKYDWERELLRLKNMLGDIIDSMPSIIIGIDEMGNVSHWNKQAEKKTGYLKYTAIGKKLKSVYPELEAYDHDINHSISDHKVISREKVMGDHQGETSYSNITIFPLSGSKSGGAVIRIDDVSERVRMEVMMIQTEKMMSLGGLAAGMAHEINNPLAGIGQNIQVLKRRILDLGAKDMEKARLAGLDDTALNQYLLARDVPRLFDEIQMSVTRAAEIVRSMLNFSRISDRDRNQVLVNDLVKEALKLAAFDYQIEKNSDFNSIKISPDLDESLGEISCFRNELIQVLLNILKNAAQSLFSLKKEDIKPEIRIKTYHNKEYAIIEIADNGAGMDQKTVKRLFEPFFTTKEINKGTGLGLSVSYFIITAKHKGKLDVVSKKGEGAKFIISLPYGISINKDE